MKSLSVEALNAARFPILRVVDPGAFFALATEIASDANLRCEGDGADDEAVTVIAGQLAEVFFFRRDLLRLFFKRPRAFSLHRDDAGFRAAGGVSGGCYQPSTCKIVLRRGRLFEGFRDAWPGVAPLLHELGHMLDHIDGRSGRGRWRTDGVPLGLRRSDGAAFKADARRAFLAGRAIERARYRQFMRGRATPDCPQPLGHPYVFQNNGEFCAGYLEMFLRNPNAFAARNPTLYSAYTALFDWDPRAAWPVDFAYYVDVNQAYYAARCG